MQKKRSGTLPSLPPSPPRMPGHVPAHHAVIQHIMSAYGTGAHIQTVPHNSHFLSVCAVANRRQHRAAENRLRHTVLHENPSFP